MKFRHLLLLLLAAITIAFMQPLVTFLGGLTLLLGVGGLIVRDLPPASQDAIEHRVLGWLRRLRTGSNPVLHDRAKSSERLTVDSATGVAVTEPLRRTRAKSPPPRSATADLPITDAKNIPTPGKNRGPNV